LSDQNTGRLQLFTGFGASVMSLKIRIQDFTAEEICDLLLLDNSQTIDILVDALKQLIREMAGLDTTPSAAEVLSQLKTAT
jgi:hypothetical protein